MFAVLLLAVCGRRRACAVRAPWRGAPFRRQRARGEARPPRCGWTAPRGRRILGHRSG